MLERAGVAKIAIGDAWARQKCDLQQPIEHDRDLAEEERAVDVRRHHHVIEREQRCRQYRRGAYDVEEIGQRGEAPLRLVEARDAVDETGIDDEGRQQNRQESPALGKPALLEANEETRDHRRRGGQQVVHQNEPHPWREARKADHRPDLPRKITCSAHQYRPLAACATSRSHGRTVRHPSIAAFWNHMINALTGFAGQLVIGIPLDERLCSRWRRKENLARWPRTKGNSVDLLCARIWRRLQPLWPVAPRARSSRI